MAKRSIAILGMAVAAEAFSPAGLPGLRAPGAGLRAQCNTRIPAIIAPKMSGDPKVVWDAGADWKSESQKMKEATSGMQMRDQSGNVDTPDYFDEDGSKVAQEKTEGGSQSKLKSMLSADKTEVRQVEKYQSGKEVKFVAHKWKIDGDFKSGDPRWALTYNSAQGGVESKFEIEPNSMTYEDFVAGFTEDTPKGWSVEPLKGTLDRRGGPPQAFTVAYKGGNPSAPLPGTLVVVLPNDNFSWTFKFQVSPA